MDNFRIVAQATGSPITKYNMAPEDVSNFFKGEKRGPLVKFSKQIFEGHFVGECGKERR